MGLLGKTGVDEMGLLRKFVDEMVVDQMGCYLCNVIEASPTCYNALNMDADYQ